MDLVSCRNLLIYLQPALQRTVLSFLHFALRANGYLFLGTSETVGDHQNAFELVNSKMRIYKKHGNNPHIASDLSSIIQTDASAREDSASIASLNSVSRLGSNERLWNAVSAKLISEFAPTCFVVNEKDEILYSFGKPHEFITLRTGRANLNLIKLVPRDLGLALSTAIRRARKQNSLVRFSGVSIREAGATRLIDLGVEPISVHRAAASALMILLQESKTALATSVGEPFDSDERSMQRIEDLEDDLHSTRDNLQSAIQQLQTSNEEFQSTNEELIASNEELQSSNEELESINEELATLNSEYQEKNEELIVANNDLENFLRTSELGTIVLNDSLRLCKFTPVAGEELNLLPHDIGRLLAEFSHPLVREICRIAEGVLSNGIRAEKTVEVRSGVRHLLRISPYRRAGTTDQGIVATILNISNLKMSVNTQRSAEQEEGNVHE
jgi:two-component system CheB/CheR fusion protein